MNKAGMSTSSQNRIMAARDQSLARVTKSNCWILPDQVMDILHILKIMELKWANPEHWLCFNAVSFVWCFLQFFRQEARLHVGGLTSSTCKLRNHLISF